MSEWADFGKEVLKLAVRPRYAFVLFLASLFILIVPLPDFLRLDPIRDEFGKFIGLVCLSAFILWLVEMGLFLWSQWQERQARKQEEEDLFKPLDSLTPAEAALLVKAVDETSRTIKVHWEDPEAASLISKRLLEKVTPFESRFAMMHPFCVPQTVWERINEEDVVAVLRQRATMDKPTK